mmetsp:Transcript_30616/g.33452  ORF Transcript_30616/g.33452 Transcript_30616/m.33452 type:complete len:249 (+) Transcript_30616:42-788(+)
MSYNEEAEIKNIVILIAMEAEGKPYIDAMHLEKVESKVPQFPTTYYEGEFHGGKVTVVLNGKDKRYEVDNVGTTPAALSAFLAITELKPDLIINAGTAGGFRKHTAQIGDVFISSEFKFHDRRIPIPGFHEYGRGNYTSHPCPHLVNKFGYKTGVVTTSNALDHSETDDVIMEENTAAVKDMEAASIAWVVEQFHTPFFAIKVITDIVDGERPTNEEFLENLHTASHSLQENLPKIIEYCMGKKLGEL